MSGIFDQIVQAVRRNLDAIYAHTASDLSVYAVIVIICLLISSLVFASLTGAAESKFWEKKFDHFRQFSLSVAVALIAVVTAGFVLARQQSTQDFNQKLERLRLIDATLTYKLDAALNSISRIYFTQRLLLGLNEVSVTGQSADLDATRKLAGLVNNTITLDQAPPITSADIGPMIDTFTIRPSSTTPFIYSSLDSNTASEMGRTERHVTITLSNLQNDLRFIKAEEVWRSVNSSDFDPKNISSIEFERRLSLAENFESIKFEIVSFAWRICMYKQKVSQDLLEPAAPYFSGERYSIELKTPENNDHDILLSPAAFLIENEDRSSEKRPNESCAKQVLRSILLSEQPFFAVTSLMDFLEDAWELKERERHIAAALKAAAATEMKTDKPQAQAPTP